MQLHVDEDVAIAPEAASSSSSAQPAAPTEVADPGDDAMSSLSRSKRELMWAVKMKLTEQATLNSMEMADTDLDSMAICLIQMGAMGVAEVFPRRV